MLSINTSTATKAIKPIGPKMSTTPCPAINNAWKVGFFAHLKADDAAQRAQAVEYRKKLVAAGPPPFKLNIMHEVHKKKPVAVVPAIPAQAAPPACRAAGWGSGLLKVIQREYHAFRADLEAISKAAIANGGPKYVFNEVQVVRK